jgi:hypothetical protein
LVPFGNFLRTVGLDQQLEALFFNLKAGPLVVYPMETQLRMLIDAHAAGEQRVFGLEALAADPLFVHLAGGVVSSIDTVYRDLARFDDFALGQMELLMGAHGLQTLRHHRPGKPLHVDIDTTVETVFGKQEGAETGYNPRYPGRNSYQALVATIAETGACIGAQLRPGNTGLGGADGRRIADYVRRVVANAPHGSAVTARIDSGGDCAELLSALDDSGARWITKARLTPDLAGALMLAKGWKTADVDANNAPSIQVCELSFQRKEWRAAGKRFRVIAVRRTDRDTGKQVQLWENLDYSVQVFITNDWDCPAEQVSEDYDGRADIESRIAEWKNGLGIAKVPSSSFNANHAMLLLKLLTHNLLRRYVLQNFPQLASWRVQWVLRALFRIPGRLVRSGRQLSIRVAPGCALQKLLC